MHILEFDREIRSFLTIKQIFHHNSFLLTILNSSNVTENNHQAAANKFPIKNEPVSVVESPSHNSVSKRKRKNDETVFHVNPINDFVVKTMEYDPSKSNTIRYVAQELFLPDNTLIYGRFLAGCWDNGLEFVDEQAIEMIASSVQMILKNILSKCIRMKKHFKITSDRKFYFDVGCEFKDPTVRNTVTKQKLDQDILTIERRNQDESSYFSTHDTSSNPKHKITLLDIYKTLQDKNLIPSHSISLLSIERLTTVMNM